VHDSNGARALILACVNEIRQILPKIVLEVRMDCAFFSEEIVRALDALAIQYTISVPFERLAQIKSKVEKRLLWHRADRNVRFFECY
jgi:hypothetical protein